MDSQRKSDLTGVVKEGHDDLKIEVANVWANRFIDDTWLPPDERIAETDVSPLPYRKD